MKNIWARPLTVVQQFDANEAISACGDQNKVYKFTCDAGWSGLTGSTVYWNGPDNVMGTSDDVKLGTYEKCQATHEASTKDDFLNGYLRKNIAGFPAGDRVPVVIWRGDNADNIHCTTKLDMSTWETAKS